jgi:hypothetical protein
VANAARMEDRGDNTEEDKAIRLDDINDVVEVDDDDDAS